MLFLTGTAATSILSFAVSFVSLITADSAVCHFHIIVGNCYMIFLSLLTTDPAVIVILFVIIMQRI